MSSTIICMRVNVMYEGLQHIHREMRVFLVVVDYRKIKPNTQKPVNYFYTIKLYYPYLSGAHFEFIMSPYTLGSHF